MSNSSDKVECLVVGGGLAGAMAGLRLAEAGREVLLIEREREARPKVCGEFLSAEAVGYLRRCGVDPTVHGAKHITILRFSAAGQTIEIPLPFTALALSRSVLDEAMLECAARSGCRILRGLTIERMTCESEGWHAAGNDRQSFRAAHVFLATGKHDLRGWHRPAGIQNDLLGFKMHWRLAPPQAQKLASAIELVHFRGGYGGLVGVENGWANLSVVIRRCIFQSIRGWPGLLLYMRKESQLLNERLTGAEPAWQSPLAISSIPYGHLTRDAVGCWRIGDQAAVIPSFTGDGMAIALHSAALAVEMFLGGKQANEYQRALRLQLKSGIWIATALSCLMASGSARIMAPAAMALLPLLLKRIAIATRIPHRALLVGHAGT